MAPNVASSSELSIYSLLPLVSKLQDLLEPTLDTLIKIYAKKRNENSKQSNKGQEISGELFLVFSSSKKKKKTFFPTSALASKKLPNEKCKHFIILN